MQGKIAELPKVNFDLEEAQRLFDTSPTQNIETFKKVIVIKDTTQCKEYIKKYFYPMKDGGHFMWDNNKFVPFHKDVLKDTYLGKLPDEICTWYFRKYLTLYEAINSVTAPLLEGKKINLCAGLKWKERKAFASFAQETQLNVHLFIKYMKDVLCCGDEELLQYILKWYSNMVKGKKNNTLLYFKGPGGIGKSTNTEFLRDYVIGEHIYVPAQADIIGSK
jgi:hypothetical protein